MPQRNPGQSLHYANNGIPSSASGNFMGSHTPPQYQGLTNQNLGNLGGMANYQGQNNQNSGNYANYQGISGQSNNGMMGSESVQHSQSVMYSQPSPVYPGPSSSSSSDGSNYHSSSLNHQSSYAQPQGYGKSSSQGLQNYNNGFAARQGTTYGSSSKFHSNSAQKKKNSVGPEVLRQYQASGRSDEEEYTVPSDVDMKDAAKIVAGLKGML